MANTLPKIVCPHCAHDKAALVAYMFDNGSAKWSELRCELCNAHWRVNRQYQFTELLARGWTPAERIEEMTRFAAMQSEMVTLHKHNAPSEWYRYVRT